jgi:copper transport protein
VTRARADLDSLETAERHPHPVPNSEQAMSSDEQLTDTDEHGQRPDGLEARAVVLGRVLAGELTEQAAADRLGVSRAQLVRWKADILERLEAPDVAPSTTSTAASAPAAPVHAEARAPSTPQPDARPAPVEPRLVAAVLVGIVGLAVAFALARPTGLSGLEVFDTLNRWVLYASTLFTAGGVLYLWRLHDGQGSPSERHALTWWTQLAAVVAAITSMIALAVHGAAIAGVGPAGMIDHHEVGRAADGAFGVSTVMRLLGLVYIAYALRRLQTLSAMLVAVTGMLLTLGSFLLIGHTATGQPRSLVVVSDLVHTLAASGWFAGLVLLAMTLRHRRAAGDVDGAARIVGRFSTFAAVSVAALFASGVAMALTEISTWSGLFTHEYGQTLLVKTGLVLTVLLAAAYNRWQLVPRIRDTHTLPASAWGRLHTTLGAETTGLVVVLLATALLVDLGSPG